MDNCFLCKKEVSWTYAMVHSVYGPDDLKFPPPRMSIRDIVCHECGEKLKNMDEQQIKEKFSEQAISKNEIRDSPTGGFITEPEEKHGDEEIRASTWWFLLPIFLGWIGGLIAFLILRKEDYLRARNCLLIGIGLTVASGLIYLAIMPSLNSLLGL